METIRVLSPKIELNDRTLWFDGESSFNPENLQQLIGSYEIKYVNYENNIVKQYNKFYPDKILVKTKCVIPEKQWIIPDEFKSLDVETFLLEKHDKITKNISQEEKQQREYRLVSELLLYKRKKLYPTLQALIFIINTLTSKNVVWGVGRGSSVSSYVLFVIGTHDVDSFGYQLDVNEFLSEQE